MKTIAIFILCMIVGFCLLSLTGCMKEARYCEYQDGKITKRISLFRMGFDTEIKGFTVDIKEKGAKVSFDSQNEQTSQALINTSEAAKSIAEAAKNISGVAK